MSLNKVWNVGSLRCTLQDNTKELTVYLSPVNYMWHHLKKPFLVFVQKAKNGHELFLRKNLIATREIVTTIDNCSDKHYTINILVVAQIRPCTTRGILDHSSLQKCFNTAICLGCQCESLLSHSISIVLRSGLWLGHTWRPCCWSHSVVDLLLCFGSSCCITYPLLSFSWQTDGLKFSCKMSW